MASRRPRHGAPCRDGRGTKATARLSTAPLASKTGMQTTFARNLQHSESDTHTLLVCE